MASVSINQIYKSYGSTPILKGINFEIANGEFVVLVGPSGCGKSTLLRMIAGLEEVNQGEVKIDNQVVNTLAPKDRDIAMVFQNYALYPHMSVQDNMSFSLRLAKRPAAEIEARTKAAADILGLDQLLLRFPRELSGGQRQRVAMGRAIVRDPKVFLFDEPLSNLDAKLRVQMRTEIKALHQRLKTTSVYVTHDQIEAMTMADKIVIMHDGMVEQMGAPLDVYDNPENLFVAGFIGSPAMNFLRGTYRQKGDAAWVEFVDGGKLAAPVSDIHDGHAVIFGMRPEHLSLANGSVGLSCKVNVVETTGATTELFCLHGKTEICVIFHDRHHFVSGETVTLVPKSGRVYLFDVETQQRLR
ncbi:sn-glycerol-3-phosphate ABC transporter ATP-binding protein UgpC [Herbaspirillum sp. RTI4]|uniref:ABC transporter ATP-binding protein n=1 Tax=Herbaspirillum sp. RTI4 TaxID=3048640 RepID=UPI002AB4CFCB|nr:sn-glycerol-3-phosphate ABC transporter ATP-binding protein UgpC [Herbaspirillum sp. RTI4]MDY7578772.1 sn-glycerol-3-phosphate ABC transporter ATP-binding protein UgpC [Herbaspirillum sp. RTI4]MEA9982308.1 sn-glycerol-3-phosphate ABC transporter ATP-binding protein UgpC [Herbaspirillum sp. RTI4]